MLKKINPIFAPLALYAFNLYKKQKYQQAEKIFKSLLDKQPDNAYLNFRYGMVFLKLNKMDLARVYISKAVELDSNNTNWQVQLNAVDKHLMHKKSVDNKLKVKNLEMALLKNANDPNFILSYADALLVDKKYWQAKFQYEKYLTIEPKSVKVLTNLGNISEKLFDFEKAVEYFKEANNLKPNSVDCLYRIAFNLEKSGNLEEANVYYSLASNISDSDEVKEFGVGYWHAKRGLWDLAILAYQRFQQETHSENPELYYRMGVAYEKQYLWKDAGNAYKTAISLLPIISAEWCYKCGQAFERANLLDDAVEYYQEAVNRSDNYKAYWYYRLASVLEQKGNFELSAYYHKQSNKRQFCHAMDPKNIINDKEEDFLSIYTEYYETLSINDKLIMVESFSGDTISCNPYAILSYLLDNQYNYTYIVVVKNDDTIIPSKLKYKRNIIFVKRNSDAYLRYLCSAKYLINNVSFPFYFIRKDEQIYLNTWHGTPMKHLGKDIKSPFMDFANVARNFLHSTHIISPNRFTSDIILDRYNIKDLFNGKIAETGYPRVDISFNLTHERKKEIAQELKISNDKPVVLYAPTWRGTSQSKKFDTDKLQADLKSLKSDQYYLIFRGHHYTEKFLQSIKLDGIIIAPKHIDSNELLGVCDLLITDYSSIIYDFLALNKPAICYIYDYEEYKKSRGLYVNASQMPGEVCRTVVDIKKYLSENIHQLTNNIAQAHIDEYSYLDDGRASKRVVDFMFDKDDSKIYNYKRRKSNLFFNGPFQSNGISTSFINLISSLENKDKNIALLINVFDIASNQKYINELSKLDLNKVSVIPRVGRMPMTLQELWVKRKFEETYQFYSEEFKSTLLKIYKREARRILATSCFDNVINFEGYSLYFSLLLSQINAQRHIIYQHNDMYREWHSKYPYLKGVFEVYSLFDKIISVSEKTMENNCHNLANRFNLSQSKFVFCENSINIEKIINGSKKEIKMEQEFVEFTGKKIINIGRMSHEKDQIKLIEAFFEAKKNYSDMRLFILGDGALKQDLIAKIKSLSLENDVFLLGQKENPYPYLKNSDVFVLSSNHEGQPMVLLEALILNKPIVATDIVGNRSILSDQYGIIVDNSKDGLKNGILLCLEKISQSEYQDNFDAETYQKQAIDKFNSLLYK